MFHGLQCEKELTLLICTHNDAKLRPNPSYYHRFTTSLPHRHHQTLLGISTKVYCVHLSEVLRAYLPIPATLSCSDLFIFSQSTRILPYTMPSTSSLPSIVTNGALLTIEGERRYNGPDSEGGTGFVSRVHDDGTFDINLSVGGVEKNVHPRRIQNSTPLATTARRRSIADDSATRPSLISINHVPSRRSSPVIIAADVSTSNCGK